jgi:hypothetical protein
MTSQRLYGIIKYLDSLDQKLALQTTLETIKDTLGNLVSSPGQPQYQNTLATALSSFRTAVAGMAGSISPSQAAIIKDIGGAEFFDPELADKVMNSIQTNAMTPSVARDFVQDIATRRATFLTNVRSARQSLEKLGITEADLKPGTADVSFLIPRKIFDNELALFARELKFISRLVQDFTEAQTGKAEPVLLEQLSSSIPTVALIANLVTLSLLGTVINKFLDAWLKAERIRKARAELDDMGITGDALKQLDDRIATTVEEVIEESTELVVAKYPGAPERKRELENSIRLHTSELFLQIEKGLTVEFRAEPQPGEGEDQKNLKQIADVSKVLKFPQITNGPLLLGKGEPLDEAEDVVLTRTRKTRRTTTTKKEAPKEKDGKE